MFVVAVDVFLFSALSISFSFSSPSCCLFRNGPIVSVLLLSPKQALITRAKQENDKISYLLKILIFEKNLCPEDAISTEYNFSFKSSKKKVIVNYSKSFKKIISDARKMLSFLTPTVNLISNPHEQTLPKQYIFG